MRHYKSGKCRICGTTFLGFEADEYDSTVSRHILEEHRDQPPDKVIVERL